MAESGHRASRRTTAAYRKSPPISRRVLYSAGSPMSDFPLSFGRWVIVRGEGPRQALSIIPFQKGRVLAQDGGAPFFLHRIRCGIPGIGARGRFLGERFTSKTILTTYSRRRNQVPVLAEAKDGKWQIEFVEDATDGVWKLELRNVKRFDELFGRKVLTHSVDVSSMWTA